jgi:hypothetical protein
MQLSDGYPDYIEVTPANPENMSRGYQITFMEGALAGFRRLERL